MASRPHPPAARHGALRALFDEVWMVTGTVRLPGPVTSTFSRNMVVLREGGALTIVNSMRLDDAGLAALDALGKVEHVVRLAAFHGMDDPFYAERYGAKVWALEGTSYGAGFDADPSEAYFEPDVRMTADTALPIAGARLVPIASAKPPEGLLLLEREGGILVAGDALQNMSGPDAYFNFAAKVVMRLMGFFTPHNVGPAWRRAAKPDAAEVKALLDLDFEHVLPAHGEPVIGGAREKYRPAIERVS